MTGNCGFPDGAIHMHQESCYQAGRRDERAVVAQRLAAAEAAVARVEALVAPQWRNIPMDFSDVPMDAFVDGRNWMIDRIRAALTPDDTRDSA